MWKLPLCPNGILIFKFRLVLRVGQALSFVLGLAFVESVPVLCYVVYFLADLGWDHVRVPVTAQVLFHLRHVDELGLCG